MKLFIIFSIVVFVCSIFASNHEHKQKRKIAQRNNPKSQHKQQNQSGVTRMSFDELQQYVKSHGGSLAEIPESVMIKFSDKGCFELSENDFIEMNKNINNRKKRETIYQIISEHRVAGMNYESNDDSENAIKEYASAIKIGESCNLDMLHAYRYAYDRLLVLLRRAHRYDELRSICESYATHDIDDKTRTRINNIIQSI